MVNQSLPTGPGWTLLQSSQSRGVVTEPTSRAAGHRAGQGRGPQARLQGALPCPGLRGELIREELFGLISEVRVTVGGESLCKAVRGCEPRKHEKPGLPGQGKGWRAGGPWGPWRAPPPGTPCSLKAPQGTWSAKQPHHQLPREHLRGRPKGKAQDVSLQTRGCRGLGVRPQRLYISSAPRFPGHIRAQPTPASSF